MKKIKLTKGKYALVDDEDYNSLHDYKWSAHPRNNRTSFYACRNIYIKGSHARGKNKYHWTQMHRLIMKAKETDIVDHINHDTLDNRKENLRICTRLENCRNQITGKRNTSGYKGVSWSRGNKKWMAQSKLKGKHIHLGYFVSKEKAAGAYNIFAKQNFGEYAYLNNI